MVAPHGSAMAGGQERRGALNVMARSTGNCVVRSEMSRLYCQ